MQNSTRRGDDVDMSNVVLIIGSEPVSMDAIRAFDERVLAAGTCMRAVGDLDAVKIQDVLGLVALRNKTYFLSLSLSLSWSLSLSCFL